MDVMLKVAVAFFSPFVLLIVNLIGRYLLSRIIPHYTYEDMLKSKRKLFIYGFSLYTDHIYEAIFKSKRKFFIFWLSGFLFGLGILLFLNFLSETF